MTADLPPGVLTRQFSDAWVARQLDRLDPPRQLREQRTLRAAVEVPDDAEERLQGEQSVPLAVLQDGGTTLWESNVIVRYLAVRFPAKALLPTDATLRFEAEQWMDWQQTTLNPAGRNGFLQWFRTVPALRSADLLQQSAAATEPLMALLDKKEIPGDLVARADDKAQKGDAKDQLRLSKADPKAAKDGKGAPKAAAKSYTDVFGETLVTLAEQDQRRIRSLTGAC